MGQEKGYIIKENAPIYLTTDMDKTLKWFKEILGWHGGIDERNEQGKGTYGCVFDLPQEVATCETVPFTGIHLFYGEPKGGYLSFMYVEGIDNLRQSVLDKGWQEITEISCEPWGGKTCSITTIDGYILYCFQ